MNPIRNHEKVALQFSGGKDSLALATLLRPFSHKVHVFWVRTAEQFPETLAAVEWVKGIYPHFHEVLAVQPSGIPSDVVPEEATLYGRQASGSTLPHLIGRYECCWKTIMVPLDAAVREWGATLVVRGQKDGDALKSILRSGMVQEGVQYWFPLEGWSDAQVFTFLRRKGTPVPSFYDEGLHGGLDCPGCSAWWPEKRMKWLKTHHPIVATAVYNKLEFIRSQVQPVLRQLAEELQDGE